MPSCRGCGRAIIFGKTNDGKWVPLEKSKHVYDVDWDTSKERPEAIAHKIERDIYISHYLMCPEANQFSTKKDPMEQLQLMKEAVEGKKQGGEG